MSTSADRAASAIKALLAQTETQRNELEEVLIELAGSLAEADPARLVARLLDATRRTAAAGFGFFLPDGGGQPTYVQSEDDPGFAKPPAVSDAPLLSAAVQAGEVLVIDDLERWARSQETRKPYGVLAGGGIVRSWLVLPVHEEAGGSHGSVVLGHPDPHRFDHRRERLARALAQHLAGALDRAREHHEHGRVARVLQETLLPPLLPSVPGLDLSARYRATGVGNLVGGDFYDVFEAEDGVWAVVLGDVSGFGPEAAAITGQARYTVRAVARDEPTPSGVLRRLNEAIGGRTDDRFCTAVYLRMEPSPTGVEMVLSRGGHPPPLVLREGGEVEALDAAAGMPLGMFPDAQVSDLPCTLSAGDAMVLYTDGVIEARDDSGEQFGQERLEDVLRSCAGRTADGIARRIELAAMDFQSENASDDVAIVVARAWPSANPDIGVGAQTTGA
ncbi:MAG: GAF domain-containing SpoIIE family protein phosphatase [Acidimicrobiales bacterium]